MKTLLLREPGSIELVNTEKCRQPQSGEAAVQVRHVGLCGTDIHAFAGNQPFFTYPRILGHELGVVVDSVGEGVEHVSAGDHCAVEPYLSRPGDIAFERGKTNCSASTQCLGVHVDGGMREKIILPADKLHPSKKLDTRSLALVETLGIGCHAVERAVLSGDEKVAVIGAGPIGLTVIQFTLLRGSEILVLDASQERLDQCKRLFPQCDILKIDPGRDLRETIQQERNLRPEYVFDCTGNASSMEKAIALPAHGGTVVLVGLCRDTIRFSDPDFHARELSILSSRNATAENFREIIAYMENGKIQPHLWITHTCLAEEFPNQIDDWLKPGSGLLKGIIEFK